MNRKLVAASAAAFLILSACALQRPVNPGLPSSGRFTQVEHPDVQSIRDTIARVEWAIDQPLLVNQGARTDIVVRHRDPVKGLFVRTKFSNGDGTWTEHDFQAGDGSGVDNYPMLAGRVNSDGLSDLILRHRHPSLGLFIRTKLSNGDGTWQERDFQAGDGRGVDLYPALVGDVDGDGDTDLILRHRDPLKGLFIRTKFSNGDGTWTEYDFQAGDGNGIDAYPALVADVNGDGKSDLVLRHRHPQKGLFIRTKMSNGNGTWTEHDFHAGDGSGVDQFGALVGLVNRDNRTDLILRRRDPAGGLFIRTKFSNGDGTWTEFEHQAGDGNGVDPYPAIVGDMDGDGASDLILRHRDPVKGLFIRTKRSNGDGTWAEYEFHAGDGGGVDAYPAMVADFDGDGRSDLVLRHRHPATGLFIRTKRSNGDGSWSEHDFHAGDGIGVDRYTAVSRERSDGGHYDPQMRLLLALAVSAHPDRLCALDFVTASAARTGQFTSLAYGAAEKEWAKQARAQYGKDFKDWNNAVERDEHCEPLGPNLDDGQMCTRRARPCEALRSADRGNERWLPFPARKRGAAA
ncbi:MAG TPA: VCBS repeat-containing protein [Allosphingosinicella sp.]